ncbi:MAG: hypothetical protein NW216_12280 [Hyphomicrobium sp.]|nr:hypothetical protein [Hyphomicrobium sp.]
MAGVSAAGVPRAGVSDTGSGEAAAAGGFGFCSVSMIGAGPSSGIGRALASASGALVSRTGLDDCAFGSAAAPIAVSSSAMAGVPAIAPVAPGGIWPGELAAFMAAAPIRAAASLTRAAMRAAVSASFSAPSVMSSSVLLVIRRALFPPLLPPLTQAC